MFRTRRQFLQTAVAAGAGLTLGSNAVSAIEPIQRNGKPLIKLSIAAYSYRKYLALNIKPKPPMTLEDFAEIAADMNLRAIEPTAYYFADTSPEYLARLKGKCTRLGLDISGTAIGNNFCVTDPEKMKVQKTYVRDWIERTSRLGGKTVRIFAGNVEKGDTE
jgi:sugar phosphate isomerase/epimerase